MQDVAAPQTAIPAIHPPKIELGRNWPFAIFAFAFLALIYMVGADEGAASVIPGTIVHEFVHDGRHLLGFPCH
ncbi:MAG: CbtB-domain containing protein [Solirubrobacteraceae bacterium]|nr:CbtB-domain containing protein [Solirubrobacteraceae bacterium]